MSGRPGSRLTPVWWAGADAEPVLRVVRLGGSTGCVVPSDRAKASRGGGCGAIRSLAQERKPYQLLQRLVVEPSQERKDEKNTLKIPQIQNKSLRLESTKSEWATGRQRRQLLRAAKADGGISSWSAVRELTSATESQLQRLKDLTRRWQAEPCTSASNHETRNG